MAHSPFILYALDVLLVFPSMLLPNQHTIIYISMQSVSTESLVISSLKLHQATTQGPDDFVEKVNEHYPTGMERRCWLNIVRVNKLVV